MASLTENCFLLQLPHLEKQATSPNDFSQVELENALERSKSIKAFTLQKTNEAPNAVHIILATVDSSNRIESHHRKKNVSPTFERNIKLIIKVGLKRIFFGNFNFKN